MGMVVRTNTMATNAYRSLSANQSAVAKSLEKLSSGFRINRAG
ncbi:MAG: flagellin, partial [Clostridiales bacterium]|nr:flagellin [Clostridiales bacterium]